jgi:thiamine biosynthesis lipoprotein
MPKFPVLPFWVIGLLFSLILSGCNAPSPEPQRQAFYVFGTVVNVELYADDPKTGNQAIHQVEQRFQRFNREWHAWEQGGLVSKINQAIAQKKPVEVPANVKAFILKSQKLNEESLGYFDPGIGTLIALWGFHADSWQGPPPSLQAIKNYLKNPPSIADLYFQGNLLYSKNPNVSLDFGGNAKGLALDIAMQTLKNSGIENAIVNIGGDMRVMGEKPNGEPWRIGIQDPLNPEGKPIEVVALKGDASIVTSGTYQRYYQWQGQSFSHLLNPKTGYPIDHEGRHFVSVTVIHPDATTADAAATALIVAGPNHWQAVAKRMGIAQAMLIDNEGRIFTTPDFNEQFQ